MFEIVRSHVIGYTLHMNFDGRPKIQILKSNHSKSKQNRHYILVLAYKREIGYREEKKNNLNLEQSIWAKLEAMNVTMLVFLTRTQ